MVDQYEGLQNNGQFRFTPATHAMLAFNQALEELDAEGGPQGRGTRYNFFVNQFIPPTKSLKSEGIHNTNIVWNILPQIQTYTEHILRIWFG